MLIIIYYHDTDMSADYHQSSFTAIYPMQVTCYQNTRKNIAYLHIVFVHDREKMIQYEIFVNIPCML